MDASIAVPSLVTARSNSPVRSRNPLDSAPEVLDDSCHGLSPVQFGERCPESAGSDSSVPQIATRRCDRLRNSSDIGRERSVIPLPQNRAKDQRLTALGQHGRFRVPGLHGDLTGEVEKGVETDVRDRAQLPGEKTPQVDVLEVGADHDVDGGQGLGLELSHPLHEGGLQRP